MSSLRYFPLTSDRFEHQIGVRALLAGESIVERTDSFADEIALKRSLLANDLDNYFQADQESLPAQWEASQLLVQRQCPLLELATEVQLDTVILSGDAAAGHPIIAGVVCFPSGWTIAEKIGQSIDAVHRPVPEYDTLMSHSTDRLLARLKPGRPVWRMNWGVRPSGRLDQSPKRMEAVRAAVGNLTPQNVGERCYFRVERQTLSRLKRTGAILFTIHTHQCRLEELDDTQRQRLLGVIRTCPSGTARYKGFHEFAELVCRHLEQF